MSTIFKKKFFSLKIEITLQILPEVLIVKVIKIIVYEKQMIFEKLLLVYLLNKATYVMGCDIFELDLTTCHV